MITKPMDVLECYGIRRTKKQKSAFIAAMKGYAEKYRYSMKTEYGSFGCRNIVIGDAQKAEIVVTAHYDTCAWMLMPNFVTPFTPIIYVLYQIFVLMVLYVISLIPGAVIGLLLSSHNAGYWIAYVLYWLLCVGLMFGPANRHNVNDNTSGVITVLEMMASLPENQRHKVCFVLFDLEEMGTIGSSCYRKAHKGATDRQLVLNLDCVGDGDTIVMMPSKALRRNESAMSNLSRICRIVGRKRIVMHQKGPVIYPSDHMHFPNSVAIAAFQKTKFIGYYMDRIHTHRDTVLDRTNVNILRAALISLISVPTNTSNTSKG